jgi:hypothetical protein
MSLPSYHHRIFYSKEYFKPSQAKYLFRTLPGMAPYGFMRAMMVRRATTPLPLNWHECWVSRSLMTTAAIETTAEELLQMPNDGFRYELVRGKP